MQLIVKKIFDRKKVFLKKREKEKRQRRSKRNRGSKQLVAKYIWASHTAAPLKPWERVVLLAARPYGIRETEAKTL